MNSLTLNDLLNDVKGLHCCCQFVISHNILVCMNKKRSIHIGWALGSWACDFLTRVYSLQCAVNSFQVTVVLLSIITIQISVYKLQLLFEFGLVDGPLYARKEYCCIGCFLVHCNGSLKETLQIQGHSALRWHLMLLA